jgi:hypothetical protein
MTAEGSLYYKLFLNYIYFNGILIKVSIIKTVKLAIHLENVPNTEKQQVTFRTSVQMSHPASNQIRGFLL